jgi:multidrug efflux pump subunit AcrA (membrane-fusion protein)
LRRWQKILIWALVIAVVGGGITWIILARNSRSVEPPPLAKVERGKISQTLSLAGSVSLLDQVNVTARTTGKVASVLVEVGQQVDAGQELILLSSPELDDQVSLARVNLESAQLRLKQLEDGLSGTDLAPLQIALDKAKNDLTLATDAQARAEESVVLTSSIAEQAVEMAQRRLAEVQSNRSLSQQSLDLSVQAAEDGVAYAEKDLQTAQDDLKEARRQKENAPNDSAALVAEQLVKAAERSETLAQRALDAAHQKLDAQKLTRDQQLALAVSQGQSAQDALTQAQQAQEQRALANRDSRIQANNGVQIAQFALQVAQANHDKATSPPSSTTLDLAQKAVDSAQLSLNALLRQQGDAVIRASVKGTVGSINVKVGDTLAPSVPLMVLVNTQALEIQVNVPEVNVGQLSVGQSAEITTDAYRDRSFHGVMESISPLPTVIQGVVSYSARFSLDSEAVTLLKPGMSAQANVVVAESNNTLIIPRSSVSMRDSTFAVERWDGSQLVKTQIQPGIITDTQVEVKTGLQEGDQISISASSNRSSSFTIPGLSPTTSAP